MSGGSGGPIIIRTLVFSDPSKLPATTVARLREIADQTRDGVPLSLSQRLFVARTVFAYLRPYSS